jgi:deoxyhypusine monooxygenase
MGVDELKSCLLDYRNQSVAMRTHAAFHLRTLNTGEAVGIICEALLQREDSELMRHELAYILGQMQNVDACLVLERVLRDRADDALVRHEAAEALGAIGNMKSLAVLEEFCADAAPEVSDTCKLAVSLLKWKASAPSSSSGASVFNSVDPAPAEEGELSTEDLRATLLDDGLDLFKRYRAMFALRNQNTDASALALVDALADKSALVRHEIAYVLGQMQRTCTVPGLAVVLRDIAEHRMVRHEAAEALGAIGGTEAEDILRPFQDDHEMVVKESCDVALDTMDYWANGFAAEGEGKGEGGVEAGAM